MKRFADWIVWLFGYTDGPKKYDRSDNPGILS
jgi:hypothetical protein